MVTKKVAQGRTKSEPTNRRTKRVPSSAIIETRGLNYKKILRRMRANPLTLYLAGGVGAFYFGRFLFKYYKNHPEISTFFKENFDTVENKLRNYKDSFNSDEIEARH